VDRLRDLGQVGQHVLDILGFGLHGVGQRLCPAVVGAVVAIAGGQQLGQGDAHG
jgi:uncharacterized membrane protein YeaQ/YmgE (transglycosylase-associated protein family)